ncbi:hypothetical protein EYC84_000257 [Monilinia fructicola]|uniref:Plasma membrane proteolipid 3 n=1 Tax=Monilinia fructicola TaxID=38448 RepID=A0A5M9JMY7_MONFR|nr:hypothetical protein EYC84_000257 [Monilinia fructicola]
MIRERLLLFIINIFCPPVTVMAVAGVGADCLLNTILLLLGVLPSHIHAFYITCTYFSRKAKVRKGQYPGGPKMGIYSERVWYGGASARRVQLQLNDKTILRQIPQLSCNPPNFLNNPNKSTKGIVANR